jgi:predicted permease
MTTRARPPLAGRILLRLCRLGDRRAEVERDLADLFVQRAASRGTRAARARYLRDVVSFFNVRMNADRRDPASPGAATMDSILHDVRYSIRAFRRRPLFAAAASLTLALGFGANVAVFAVIDSLFFGGPPHVTAHDRVRRVHVDTADPGGGRFTWFQTPHLIYQGLRARATGFEQLTAYRRGPGSIGTGADARPVQVAYADGNYFRLFGVTPVLGRLLFDADNAAPPGASAIVLSETFWRGAFGGDVAVVGRDVRLGARTYTVIGVAPAGFSGDSPEPIDAWVPLYAAAPELPPTWMTSPTFRSLSVVGRLRPGVTPQQAADQAAPIVRGAAATGAAADPSTRVLVAALTPGLRTDGAVSPEGRMALWLQGVSVLVLVVAIASVVNLQVTRAIARQQEIAVRLAIGISRGRLFRQVGIETALLTGVAGTLAVVGAGWMAGALQRLLTPTAAPLALSGRVLAATAGCVAATTLVCAVIAATQARATRMAVVLRSGRGTADAGGRSWLRQALLVTQVAVSLALLIGAGLFLRSVRQLGDLQFGMDPDRVLVVSVPLQHAGYEPAAVRSFYERALAALRSMPQVEAATAGLSTPFAPSLSATVSVPGIDPARFTGNRPTFYAVTPGHFRTMGSRILRGRDFTDADGLGAAPVMIVEQALGEYIWPGEDPIGRCIRVGAAASDPCREIVGVSSNTRRFVGTASGALRYYLPIAQLDQAVPAALLVRPTGDVETAIPSVRAALQEVAPDLPYARIRVLRELSEPETRQWRLGATLFTVFGAIALAVAAFGLYGLLSALVAQQTRDMGVRLALGAAPRQLVALVLSQSLARVGVGLAIGGAGALLAARFVEPLLFETRAFDPAVFLAAPTVLIVVALAASIVPAWRASRIDPTVSLRADG